MPSFRIDAKRRVRNPYSLTVVMDSGLAASRRPGMTENLMPIRPAFGLFPAGVGALPIPLPIAGRADAVDAGRAGDLFRRRGIEHHHRLFAIAGLIERLAQQTPIGADRLVRGAEMLRRA